MFIINSLAVLLIKATGRPIDVTIETGSDNRPTPIASGAVSSSN